VSGVLPNRVQASAIVVVTSTLLYLIGTPWVAPVFVATMLVVPSAMDSTGFAERGLPLRRGSPPFVESLRDVGTVFAFLNARRAAAGLPALVLDPRLCDIARSYARDMDERGYFGHTSPEGTSPWGRMDAAHYSYGYAAENLALETDARAADDDWWRSAEHRDNMLGPHYQRVGIATVASPGGELFVEDFSD